MQQLTTLPPVSLSAIKNIPKLASRSDLIVIAGVARFAGAGPVFCFPAPQEIAIKWAKSSLSPSQTGDQGNPGHSAGAASAMIFIVDLFNIHYSLTLLKWRFNTNALVNGGSIALGSNGGESRN